MSRLRAGSGRIRRVEPEGAARLNPAYGALFKTADVDNGALALPDQ